MAASTDAGGTATASESKQVPERASAEWTGGPSTWRWRNVGASFQRL